MDTLITTQKTVSALMQDFKNGNIGAPEIQRDVVWDSEQVKKLIDSIDLDYPCGSLILWRPREHDKALVETFIRPERRKYFEHLPEYFVLDGQQRLTALASALLPRDLLPKLLPELPPDDMPPLLYGNLRHRFPREIDATTDGVSYKFPWVLLNRLFDGSVRTEAEYHDHLTAEQRQAADAFTQRVRDYQFPVQIISGRNYRTVAEIFTRVNNQGTQLTGAEIYLARIVPRWKDVTKKIREYRDELRQKRYELDLTFMLRAVTVIECRVPQIQRLADKVSNGKVSKRRLDQVWRQAKTATSSVVRTLKHQLNLDHTRFFTSKNVLIPLVYYSAAEKSRSPATRSMLRFFLTAQLSEHYGASGETTLRRDLKYLTQPSETPRRALDELVDSVRSEAKQYYRGLKVKPSDVAGLPSKNVMLLMMYMIMRRRDATDFGLGSSKSLSDIDASTLQIHHIFPFNFMMTDKAAQRFRDDRDLTPPKFRAMVDDIANMTFISQERNVSIGDASPWQYLENETDRAGRRAHFIPENTDLWRTENFEKFLGERRRLLAAGMNSLLTTIF